MIKNTQKRTFKEPNRNTNKDNATTQTLKNNNKQTCWLDALTVSYTPPL